jgi:hypothetical protein
LLEWLHRKRFGAWQCSPHKYDAIAALFCQSRTNALHSLVVVEVVGNGAVNYFLSQRYFINNKL